MIDDLTYANDDEIESQYWKKIGNIEAASKHGSAPHPFLWSQNVALHKTEDEDSKNEIVCSKKRREKFLPPFSDLWILRKIAKTCV